VARLAARPLIRLQCYEGIDGSKALYEWDYRKQLLWIQAARGVVPERDEAVPFAVQGRERLLRRLGQAGALTAPLRQVPHHPVRVVSELHRRARLALRPAWLTAALLPQRLRRRLRQPVRRRGLELFCEFCPTLAA
jgi:hypothetical protein